MLASAPTAADSARLLTGERAMGATFAAKDIGWIDFETRSTVHSIKAGTYRYATGADAVLCSWAIGNDPVSLVVAPSFDRPLTWSDMPPAIQAHHARVCQGQAVWAAYNAGFDRAIWNFAIDDTPYMAPHHIIDVMAQAVASGLAPDLSQAAKQSGSVYKVAGGKELIRLFCNPDSTATPQSHPSEWQLFQAYAIGDTEAMRSVFKGTRQLPLAEWREYWAMEAINDRGIGIDLAMVEHAATLANDDRIRSAKDIAALTGGRATGVDQVAKLVGWLLDVLPEAGREILTARLEELDEETGAVTRPAKYQLTRKQVERLIALCQDKPELVRALRVLQIRRWGGSKTPAKFSKMLLQQVDCTLYGQYVFNGAPGTGRASSKGVQIHNLARDILPDETSAIDALLARCSYDELTAAAGADPVSRKLSLLIRPAFVPSVSANVFVWSDWSQIEARILPWLAGPDPGALARLKLFRDVDNDPQTPDLYTRTAAAISGIPVATVDKPTRQRGKVAELALGFGGGVGSLHNMGANYGLFLTDAEAKTIVTRWREANAWAVGFWNGLWSAIDAALTMPGAYQTAGRITYVYAPNYLGGSLLCILPSGRFLTYRDIRYEKVADLDDDDKPTGSYSTRLRFSRGHGRVNFWHGLACENVVQATAADFLRGTLVRLETEYPIGMPVRLHTHDEILMECDESQVDRVKEELREVMQRGFDWSAGLPLMSEETAAYYYTKNEKAHGL